ncbi:MAG TPA: hypothetical protein VIL74_07740 [Pyrinomonadaceae bacterium]|jgi:hypothetical protein
MHERFRFYAYVFLALRGLLDLALCAVIYHQAGSLAPAAGFLLICSIFYFFLFFGIKNEEFRGRRGKRVCLWREPVAYWFVVAFLVAFHLFLTVLMIPPNEG